MIIGILEKLMPQILKKLVPKSITLIIIAIAILISVGVLSWRYLQLTSGTSLNKPAIQPYLQTYNPKPGGIENIVATSSNQTTISEEEAKKILESIDKLKFNKSPIIIDAFVEFPLAVYDSRDLTARLYIQGLAEMFPNQKDYYSIQGVNFAIIKPILQKDYKIPENYCSKEPSNLEEEGWWYTGLLKEFKFSYNGIDYLIKEFFHDSCGTAGSDYTYEIEDLASQKRIADFSADGGFLLIGYGKHILAIAKDYYVFYHKEGGRDGAFCYSVGFLEGSVAYSNSQKAFCYNVKELENPLYQNGPYVSLVFSAGKFYLKIEKESFFNLPGYFFDAMLPKYYLIDFPQISEQENMFKDWYFSNALKIDQAVKNIDWSAKPEVRLGNEWLWPLLNRTVYYLLAQQEEVAWETLNQDFANFSKKYPIEIKPSDILSLKQQIQEKFKNYYGK